MLLGVVLHVEGSELPRAQGVANGKAVDILPVRALAGSARRMGSKDGSAEDFFVDAAFSKKVGDPFLVSVARSLHFKPALSKGEPTEGLEALNLGSMQI